MKTLIVSYCYVEQIESTESVRMVERSTAELFARSQDTQRTFIYLFSVWILQLVQCILYSN